MVEDELTSLDEETTMPATEHCFDGQGTTDPAAAVSRVNAREEDAYWRCSFWRERYYSAELDYEDYAPAYCVGYIGYAQYGGEYDDAERSLWANWERIKGDSRLSTDEARLAMRAAWDRMAGCRLLAGQGKAIEQDALGGIDLAPGRIEHEPRDPIYLRKSAHAARSWWPLDLERIGT
jgi:hypothetical protein